MKFCSNCGTQLEDATRFCGSCGTKQPEVQPQSQGQPQPQSQGQPQGQPQYTYAQSYGAPQAAGAAGVPSENKLKKLVKNKVWLIPVAAVASVFLIWFVVFFFRSIVGSGSLTMKGAIKAYYSAEADMNAKKYINATMSNTMLKAIKESEDMTKRELIEDLQDSYDLAAVWHDDDYEIKYRRIKIEDKDYYDRADVKDVIEEIEDDTDVKVSIQKICEVEVSYERWNYYDEEWEEEESVLTLYKSAGNWYVMPN